MIQPVDLEVATDALAGAGCIAPDEEAALLATAAAGDPARLRALVARRTTGEPLAWITGTTTFCGEAIRVEPGVYVPRAQTEAMAEAASLLLPDDGLAVDLCTGAGAVAAVLQRRHPAARVIGTDLDAAAVRCARGNGVDAVESDLAASLPVTLAGRVDVVTAVVPYVPTDALPLLPRDVLAHEPRLALDGGPHGTDLLERAAAAAADLLRPGGHLLLELGADQDQRLGPTLRRLGFTHIGSEQDDDGDLRSISARKGTGPAS